MSTLSIQLPDSVRAFAEAQVSRRGHGDVSEYVRALIEADQKRAAELEALHKEVALGVEDLEQGRFTDYESPEQIADEVKARGRKWLAERSKDRQP
jgi:Arc/MetJ-type ribon-helix-helix transcriptional regulator